MTPRFVRNLTGAVALTGLTLALACGGNDSSKPITDKEDPILSPNTPVITAPAMATTKHRYHINVTATDPSDRAIKLTATSTPHSSLKLQNSTANSYNYEYVAGHLPTYVPGTIVNDAIKFTSTVTEKDITKTAEAVHTITVVDNRHPVLEFGHTNIAMVTGRIANLTGLPLLDADGDNISWALGEEGTFPGTVKQAGSNAYVINADSVPAGDYTFTLLATEHGNGLLENITTSHVVNVRVGLPDAPSIPQLGDFNGKQIRGHIYSLRANSVDPSGLPITYHASVGITSNNASVAVVNNQITYYAQNATAATSYTDTISIWAKNSAGVESAKATYSLNIAPHTAPTMEPRLRNITHEVPRGSFITIEGLSKVGEHGDDLRWGKNTVVGTGTQVDTFTSAHGTVDGTTPGMVKITALNNAPAGSFTYRLQAEEKGVNVHANAGGAGVNTIFTRPGASVGTYTININVVPATPPSIISLVPQAPTYWSDANEHVHKLTINATDNSQGTLEYSATVSWDGGATSTPIPHATNTNNVITWNPAITDVGPYRIEAKVYNPTTLESATKTYYGTLAKNTWPIMEHHTQKAGIKIGGTQTVPFTTHDPQGDTIQWSIVDKSAFTIKTGADVSFNATGDTLTITAPADMPPGDYDVTFKLEESGVALIGSPITRDKGPGGEEYKMTIHVTAFDLPTIDSITPVTSHNQGITEHKHRVTVVGTCPEGGTISFTGDCEGGLDVHPEVISTSTVPGLDGAKVTTTVLEWTPSSASYNSSRAELIIEAVSDKDTSAVETKKYDYAVRLNTWPDLPTYTVNVTKGEHFDIPVLGRDADGDYITWDWATDSGGTLNDPFKAGGGDVDFPPAGTAGNIRIAAENMDEGTYYVYLQLTESGNNLKTSLTHVARPGVVDPLTSPDRYIITVNVKPQEIKPGNTRITSEAPSKRTVIGATKNLYFTASNLDDVADRVVSWEFTGGHGHYIINDPAPEGFEIDHTSYVAGEHLHTYGTYEPPADAATGFGAVLFGIRAHFQSGVAAYADYTLDLFDAQPVKITAGDSDINTAGKLNITVENAPWAEATYKNEAAVVLKGDNEGSLPMSATVNLNGAGGAIVIQSDDIKDGMIPFHVNLVDVEIAGYAAAGDPLLLGAVKSILSEKITYAMSGDKATFKSLDILNIPSATELETLTKQPSFTGTDLLLTYEITGPKGQKIGDLDSNFVSTVGSGTLDTDGKFTVTIPLRGNDAPIFNNGDAAVDGDDIYALGGKWVDPRPSEGIETTWTLVSEKASAPYVWYDEGGSKGVHDPLWLKVVEGSTAVSVTGKEPKITTAQTAPLAFDAEWKLTWTPAEDAAGDDYTINVMAYDKYGAASDVYTISGKVWGSLHGAAVVREWYGNDVWPDAKQVPTPRIIDFNATTQSIPHITFNDKADFDGAKDFMVMSHYLTKDSGYKYYSGSTRVGVPEAAAKNNEWIAGPVLPETPYLIGGIDKNNKWVGPVVASTDFTEKHDSLPTFAFISSTTPNLSTHIPYGVRGAVIDGTVPDIWTPIQPGAIDKASYTANLMRVGGTAGEVIDGVTVNSSYTSTLKDSDAIHIIFPTVGQSGVFEAFNNTPASLVKYPVDQHEAEGWTGKLGIPSAVTLTELASLIDPSGKVHYMPFTFNLNVDTPASTPWALQYGTTDNDPILMTVMRRKERTGIVDVLPTNLYHWEMARTGRAATEIAIPNSPDALAAQQVTFVPAAPSTDKFLARVQRSTFGSFIPELTGSDPGITHGTTELDTKNVCDHLSVVSYIHGTDLGATDNINALPKLLEFGNLMDTGNTKMAGAVTFNADLDGWINVPKSQPGDYMGTKYNMWLGDNNIPVVNYVINYEDPVTYLPGSMGVIAHVADPVINDPVAADGIKRTWEPIRNLKITTADGTGNAWGAKSGFIGYNSTGAGGKYVAATVEADYFENDLVYLSWENPEEITLNPGPDQTKVPAHSGVIIEAFDGSSTLDASSVPLFKVHVSPELDYFPIPTIAAQELSGYSEVVFRVRTVTYGTPGTETFVNFNETPFKSGLPATWTDVISAPVSFANTAPPASWAVDTHITFGAPYNVAAPEITVTPKTTATAAFASAVTWSTTTGVNSGNADTPFAWTTASPNVTIGAETTGNPTLEFDTPGTNWPKTAQFYLNLRPVHNGITNTDNSGRILVKSNGWHTTATPGHNLSVANLSLGEGGGEVTFSVTWDVAASDTSVSHDATGMSFGAEVTDVTTTGVSGVGDVIVGFTNNLLSVSIPGSTFSDGDDITVAITATYDGVTVNLGSVTVAITS